MKRNETRTKVFFTGITPKYLKHLDSVCCYFCKRTGKDESFGFVDGLDSIKQLEMLTLEFDLGPVHYTVPVCDECMLILSAFTHPETTSLRVGTPANDETEVVVNI